MIMRNMLMKNLHDEFLGEATVVRSDEMMPLASPEIDVRFFDRVKPEYNFLGDCVGPHATAPYHRFAKVYTEPVVIRIIIKEPDAGASQSDGLLGVLAKDVEDTILKQWPAILAEYNSALNRSSCFARKDASFLVNGSQRFLAVEMSFKINESFEWDLVPDEDQAPEAESVDVIITQV